MRQSRRSFLDVLSRRTAGFGLMTQASGLPRAATRTTRRKRHRRRKAPRDRRCLRASRKSGSAATRTRSARARRCSTRSSASSPKRDAIRSTARRPTATLVAAIAAQVQGQARERRARRRLAGDPEERGPRVHVAVPRPRDRRADVRELPAARGASSGIRSRRSRSTPRSASTSRRWPRRAKGAGLVFLNNPNNPTATVHGARRSPTSSSASAHLAGHGDPDRRGVSRLRDRSGVRRRAIPLALADAERVRRADVLEGVRHGRHAHRLRDRRRPTRSSRWRG